MTAAIERNGVVIDDTFAEAFPMKATRIVITARTMTWARHAAVSATGFATSVIACGCEAGIERELAPNETPDGRRRRLEAGGECGNHRHTRRPRLVAQFVQRPRANYRAVHAQRG